MPASKNCTEINRPSQKYLLNIAQCPCCEGKLYLKQTFFICSRCQESFNSFRGRPVLIRKGHEFFPPDAYTEKREENVIQVEKSLLRQKEELDKGRGRIQDDRGYISKEWEKINKIKEKLRTERQRLHK